MNAFDILDSLLALEQSGKGIKEFFAANDIGKVAVYGLGRIGTRVIDEIRNSGVEIVCGIDKDAASIQCDTITIISSDELRASDDYELIIVTPVEHYYDIKEGLEQITDKDIISISEIVEYCMDGEDLGETCVKRHGSIQSAINWIDRRERSKKILVFGGSSGIGKAIAKKMADSGSKVVIAGRRIEKLFSAKQEIGLDNLQILQTDISEVYKHLSVFDEASSMMEGLDAFVNAAAISLEPRGRGYEPWDITEGEWDEMYATDFKGAFFLIRNEVDYLIKNGIAGNILNFSSNAAYMDISGIYGASKRAVMHWTHSFGKRFGHNGIVINAIAPGATFTPMISSYANNVNQPYPRHAIDRFIRPEEIANLACFMLSEKGVILSGSTVIADGGDMETVV